MQVIRLSSVYYKYPGSRDWVLKNINLSIGEGRILIVGGTGSGKTTLLRVMAGLAPEIYGGVLRGVVERRARIGFVPQNFDAFILMPRPGDEIIYVLENMGVNPDRIPERLMEIARIMGIKHVLWRGVEELSIGERQRVAIASVIAMEPEVLILDEPLAYLDPCIAGRLMDTIEGIGVKCLIVAEHRIERIIEYFDRVIAIDNGVIVGDGEPHETLYRAPPTVPKPAYMRLGFKSLEELIRVARSKRRMV